MPKLIIDDQELEVAPGTKVIEAAERLSIMIPRFCYHPGLGSVGACRMCAVKFLEGPVKGVQMSCMVDALEGMVVSTTDEEAVDFRRHVIEWLMLNHPHDCPVCDEGGECLLQDMTVSGGHSIRRYRGKKRTYCDQYLGVFVQHEMNRCIHCWRCTRFYQDFSGYHDLGALQIGNRTYFGRYTDGPLVSPFSGNLIDICPTGVYTDKPARFKARHWDLQRSPSICIHCSLGCHTVASARYREVVRMEARFSEPVNGYFICDRGRFGFDYANHPERPRRARNGPEEVPWREAVQAAAVKLLQIGQGAGSNAIACLGSTRSSLENQGMLKRFCQLQGWREPQYFEDFNLERKVKKAVSRLDARLAVSLREIEKADFILAIGADPINEAPMLALAMRQAYRNGATVAIVDPRPVFLPFPFSHLLVAPRNMDLCVKALVKGAVSRPVAAKLGPDALQFYDAIPDEYPFDPMIRDLCAAAGQKLQLSRQPVIVCGTDIVRETTPAVGADNALLLQAEKEKAGLFYLMPGANAFGAALFSSADGSFDNILEAIEDGSVKGLLLVESDPFRLFPDQKRLEAAIDKLDFLLVLDYLPSRAAQRAHMFLPTLTLFEAGGSFVNQEGRVQFGQRVHHGGIPVAQLSGGKHPERRFRSDISGGEPKAAWQILVELAHAMSAPRKEIADDNLWLWMSHQNPVFANIEASHEKPEGVRLIPDQSAEPPFVVNEPDDLAPDDGLELLLVDWTFGTEELSGYSRHTQQAEKTPALFMHTQDAARAGLETGDKVLVHLDGGPLEVKLCVMEKMAPGVLILPRHRQLAWQKLKTFPVTVPMDRIKKV
jgi:NADH-quinone oxidoreductase subunit G